MTMRPDPIVKVKHSSKQAPAASTGSVSKHFDWADITLDPEKSIVLVRQKWKYIWVADNPSERWTAVEKRNFHRRAEDLIWRAWNRKAILQMTVGASAPAASKALAERVNGRWPTIVFDIEWVTESPQWTVTVKKEGRTFKMDTDIGKKRLMLPRASVDWGTRTANLFLISLEPGVARHPVTRLPFNSNYNTPAHEFGHFLQNEDEYRKTPPDRGFDAKEDLDSIMYMGDKLRARHFESLRKSLSEMVPGCAFVVVVK